jgi:hypothetical protein
MVWRRDRINVFSVMNVMITDLTLTSSGVRRLGPGVPVVLLTSTALPSTCIYVHILRR